MQCSLRVRVGNGVQIKWRINWAPYLRLAAGSRRILVFWVAVSQDFNQIGSWLIYWGGFFFPLLDVIFVLEKLQLCVHLCKKKHYDFFFSARQLFWCFQIQNGNTHDQMDFYPVCFASFIARPGRGFFSAFLSSLTCHWVLLLSIKTSRVTSQSPAILSRVMNYVITSLRVFLRCTQQEGTSVS